MSSLLRFDPRRHLLVKLGVFQNLATHYDRSESGLRRKTVPLHRSEMSNQMSVDIKKERNHLLSLPLHDGLQTVHRTVLRLSKNRDSLTNSWLISVCFPGDLIPGLHNVPQRLVINAHNQNHLHYPVLNNHVRLQFDFVRWKHNSASLHCS